MPEDVITGLMDFYIRNDWEESYDWGVSMTRQEFAMECDINNIMARYEKTGVLPANLNGVEPMYVDFSKMPDTLMGYMEFMHDAEAAFMQLPAVVRKEFDNNAVAFVEFAADPANIEQMRTWGLAEPAPSAAPPVAEPPEPPGQAGAPGPAGAPAGPSTQSST